MEENAVSSNELHSYSASYDSATKMVSTVVCAVLAVVALATHMIVVAALGAAIIGLSYAYSPRGYIISEGSILVKRLIGNLRIPLDGIREARAAAADDFDGCVRLFGNGGLFGYYGLFRTSKLGKCTWYATNRANMVVVITGAKTALFSPNDRDGFLAAVRPSLAVSALPGTPLPTGRGSGFGSLAPKLIVAAVMIAGVSFGLLAIFYSPGPPDYTLTPNSLTIHDRFYPVTVNAAAVDVEGIRIVDFGVDTDWQPAQRANGFANSHYRSGLFRLASGTLIRVYRADSKRVVLLPPKGGGTAVLLETKEPERFVEEVRQRWSKRS
jgi:hypothetical protein